MVCTPSRKPRDADFFTNPTQFTCLIHTKLEVRFSINAGFNNPVVELPNFALRQDVYGPHESDILSGRRFQHHWRQLYCQRKRRCQDLHLGSTVSPRRAGSRRPQRSAALVLITPFGHIIDGRALTDVVLAIDVSPWLYHINCGTKTDLDTPDPEFDCVGINGEGPDYPVMVGRVAQYSYYVPVTASYDCNRV